MKITTSLLLSASLFCLVSCSETSSETNSETTAATDLETPAITDTATALTETDLGSSPETSANAATSPTVIEMPAAANAGGTTTTAPGMNPPHGQPGHDCAIAVGAPLNGSGSNAAASPQMTPVQPAPTQTAPAPASISTTAPGMNPPHGQPGHDCAVAVGAPLKK